MSTDDGALTVDAAIRQDPQLTDEQKRSLLRIYESFLAEGRRADELASADPADLEKRADQ